MIKKISAGVMIAILLFAVSIEIRPVQICHTSIFTTSENSEIKVCVLMNTFFPVDEEELAKEIILEEQQINGLRDNPVYILKMYRSMIHYRNDWKYSSFTYDENGAVICEGAETVLR